MLIKNKPMNTASWIVRDPQISTSGAKSCQIEHAKPEPGSDSKIRINVGSKEHPTKTPFGATTFDGQESSQKTIEFNISDTEVAHFKAIVDWLAGYLASHSERIFKKTMTRDQVMESIKSPVTQREGFQPHLRCKIRPSSVRVWDEYGRVREGGLPADLRGYKLVPRIVIEKLWIMSRECGFVLQVTDLLIQEREAETCPF